MAKPSVAQAFYILLTSGANGYPDLNIEFGPEDAEVCRRNGWVEPCNEGAHRSRATEAGLQVVEPSMITEIYRVHHINTIKNAVDLLDHDAVHDIANYVARFARRIRH